MTNPEWWVAFFSGIAALSPFIIAMCWWMFRIDRAIGQIKHMTETIDEFRNSSMADRTAIWKEIEEQRVRLNHHGERLSSLEATRHFPGERGPRGERG